ncbi:MAG: polysaccharide deacetylase family protein [Spirochaetales bacterium]|nr:polysaccharide deacetylase family protein [Spirochaetales bacterium]
MKKIPILLILLLLAAAFAYAEVVFESPVFGQDDNLLFSADMEVPGFGHYSTLFNVTLGDKKLQQLTVFPEEAVMLDAGRTLQIRNRYGLFRTENDFSGLRMLTSFPGFIDGKQIKTGKMFPSHPSPDGKYLAYLEPVSYGWGNLVLYNVDNGKETIISSNLDLSYSDEVVLWSPDSDFLVYSKDANVYYYSLEQFYQGKTLSEEFRKIGKGLISNIRWSAGKELFYLSDSIIYKIISAQLFTTSLYGGLMETGEIAGKIPFDFDPAFDSFYVSPDGEKIIFNKAGTNIFLYFLKNSDYISTGDVVSLPYLYLPRNTRLKKVIWPSNDIVTILANSIEGGVQKTSVFRFDLRYTDKPLEFKKIPESDVVDIELSLDNNSVAVLYSDKIIIKDYRTWSSSETFKYDKPVKAFWIEDDRMLISGRYSTEVYNIVSRKSEVLAVSQADSSGYTRDGSIFASSNGNLFVQSSESAWKRVFSIDEAAPISISDKYRVYTQTLSSGPYANMIMLRKLDSFGTESLFPYPETSYEPFPVREEEIDFNNFSHGSRIRRREISLVFNAVDSAEGLTEVLKILDDYDINATFFVNGNFMRRNPEAVQELAKSSHEVGSLFYAYFNMTDSRYRLDKEFIKRGLARNEDDYYALTGKELALFWHAPYYVVNTDIIKASGEMNYTYVNRDVDPLEWAWSMDSYGSAGLSVPQMVEKIMDNKKPGSIIPIRLGEGKEGTGALYSNLDLLLNNLIEKGYSIVPVSVLMDRARR